jgi:DNA polymerase I-like protein with 3'-5' exonuclease and polymerase domains
MIPVYLDFESFWSTNHSLSKMPAFEYVMHPETEIQSLSIKIADDTTVCVFGEDDIKHALAQAHWADSMAIGHNMSGFDSMILRWRFNIRPKMYGCTAAMARSRYAKTCGVSLKALSNTLKVGNKLDLEATNTKGKRLVDFTEEERNAMAAYNIMDTELCAALFKRLAKGFPKDELHQIDMTTRMLVEPKFVLDKAMVKKALEDVRAQKLESLLNLAQMLDISAMVEVALADDGESIEEQVRAKLASTHQFAALLRSLGVDVPMKQSPTTNGMIPALSKTDEAFLELQDHENPVVAAAARARLAVKSTLLETRLAAFLRAAAAVQGRMPVPLKYAGADTTGRWSGEHYNMQNLPRINPKEPKTSDALRMSLMAPPGKKIIVADLSGIELRVNMFLWRVQYAMALFRADPEKADLYKFFAANSLYSISEEDVSKSQRQVGKVSHLGLGFGAGGPTFQKVARLMGGIDMSLDESKGVVNKYREAHPEIVDGWSRFQQSLSSILQGLEQPIDPWGMCVTEKHAVRLPSGRRIYYPNLRKDRDVISGNVEYVYGDGRHKAKIYGGKGVENLVQALARDVVAEHALKFRRASGFVPTMLVHDEIVYVVDETVADDALAELQGIMRSGVSWWPELVTWSEGGVADRYGEAK